MCFVRVSSEYCTESLSPAQAWLGDSLCSVDGSCLRHGRHSLCCRWSGRATPLDSDGEAGGADGGAALLLRPRQPAGGRGGGRGARRAAPPAQPGPHRTALPLPHDPPPPTAAGHHDQVQSAATHSPHIIISAENFCTRCINVHSVIQKCVVKIRQKM